MRKLFKTHKVTKLKEKSKKCFEQTTKPFDTSCQNIWNPKSIHSVRRSKLRPCIIKTKQRSSSLQLMNPMDQGKNHQISEHQDGFNECNASSKNNTDKTSQGPIAYVIKYILALTHGVQSLKVMSHQSHPRDASNK